MPTDLAPPPLIRLQAALFASLSAVFYPGELGGAAGLVGIVAVVERLVFEESEREHSLPLLRCIHNLLTKLAAVVEQVVEP